jgi:glycosyltransferase involved in cell wall biosynthesis
MFMAARTLNLRVLHVTPRFSPSVGGVETHVREVCSRLPAHGIEPAVLTVDETGALPTRDVVDGVTVRRTRAFPRGRDWLFAPALGRSIRSEAADVVHVQSYHTLVAPAAMAAAARARIPYVVTFHGGGSSSRVRTRLRGVQLRALGPLLRRANTLVAIADFEIREYSPLVGVPPSRWVKVPNGADLPARVTEVTSPGRLIMSVGRLEPYKGHRRVIAALPHVIEREPQARLWIAGSGPDEQPLRRFARELGVAEHVEIGGADRSTMAGRLKGADVMVLLSDFESHPLAVLEAASLGVPAVVADNSGLAELAQQGFADAVSLAAPPKVHAEAIVRAMNNGARDALGEIPTWDACARELASLYRGAAR